MKTLIGKITLPLSIISFAIFTKWWYVLPVDAPDTMMSGFPLICVSDGWHTSMSFQIFILEFVINFSIFFLFWLSVIFFLHKIIKIEFHKYLINFLMTITIIIGLWMVLFLTTFETVYKVKRDFDIEVLTTGYKWSWQKRKRPKYKDFVPNKK